ncbi:MAG: Hpt domain-containing protein [Euryarchaeota archaeon]|nr:Hpt domain-containing protein [Euryarchaeota archaeon]MDE1834990.1 Hpt domain-containing protein [Euryarchaeota archaeon]MDE1880669.1 Hpt domain-containing protein [Euryarchaeota archaeon]MDE2044829.1 Hpt domain-containing protein [Thermoplasmata archaeon]
MDQDLEDLVPQYLENKKKDAQKIRVALDQGDFNTVRILGHSMAGSGGGYGFAGITRIGRNLEKLATEKNADGARAAVRELELYLSRVVVEYV